MQPFKITHPDDSYIALDKALKLSDEIQSLFSPTGDLMRMVEKKDSLLLFKRVNAVIEIAKNLEEWLSCVKKRQEGQSEDGE
jgi:hypothetical protein